MLLTNGFAQHVFEGLEDTLPEVQGSDRAMSLKRILGFRCHSRHKVRRLWRSQEKPPLRSRNAGIRRLYKLNISAEAMRLNFRRALKGDLSSKRKPKCPQNRRFPVSSGQSNKHPMCRFSWKSARPGLKHAWQSSQEHTWRSSQALRAPLRADLLGLILLRIGLWIVDVGLSKSAGFWAGEHRFAKCHPPL